MMEFSPRGIEIIEEIQRHMDAAADALSRLTSDEAQACFEFSQEHKSLQHCVRWGQQSAGDLMECLQAQSRRQQRPVG